MKKVTNSVRLSRSTANETAKSLIGLGQRENDSKLPKRVASYYSKTLANLSLADFNDKFFTPKEFNRIKNFWAQVNNILAKS